MTWPERMSSTTAPRTMTPNAAHDAPVPSAVAGRRRATARRPATAVSKKVTSQASTSICTALDAVSPCRLRGSVVVVPGLVKRVAPSRNPPTFAATWLPASFGRQPGGDDVAGVQGKAPVPAVACAQRRLAHNGRAVKTDPRHGTARWRPCARHCEQSESRRRLVTEACAAGLPTRSPPAVPRLQVCGEQAPRAAQRCGTGGGLSTFHRGRTRYGRRGRTTVAVPGMQFCSRWLYAQVSRCTTASPSVSTSLPTTLPPRRTTSDR